MRTEEKKRTKFIKGISGIMLMLMCVLAFSWVVGAAIVDQYIYSAEGAGCGYAVYDRARSSHSPAPGSGRSDGWSKAGAR